LHFVKKNNQHDSHATDRICLITATVLTGTYVWTSLLSVKT